MSTNSRKLIISLLSGIMLFLGGFWLGVNKKLISHIVSPVEFGASGIDSVLDERFFAQADEYFDQKDRQAILREEAASRTAGAVVASKNGSVYHLPGCPGVRRIGEENRIWFETEAQARESGYRPAKTCDGLTQNQ